MLGAFLALQFMSSIYYGLFLATLLALCAGILLCASDRRLLGSRISALAIGAFAAAVLVTPYAIPYAATKYQVGARLRGAGADVQCPPIELHRLHAIQLPVRRALGTARAYGTDAVSGRATAAARGNGTLSRAPVARGDHVPRSVWSLRSRCLSVSTAIRLRSCTTTVPVFNSLRAPARLGIFVVFFLAILAAKGMRCLHRAFRPRVHPALLLAICAILLLQYWVAPLHLVSFPNPPPLYAWLAKQPPGVVAEFPMPTPYTLPGSNRATRTCRRSIGCVR